MPTIEDCPTIIYKVWLFIIVSTDNLHDVCLRCFVVYMTILYDPLFAEKVKLYNLEKTYICMVSGCWKMSTCNTLKKYW